MAQRRLRAIRCALTRREVWAAALASCALLNVVAQGATDRALGDMALWALGGFGVSAIVWVAQYVAVSDMLSERRAGRTDPIDVAVFASLAAMIAAPVEGAAMAAQSLLCLYLLQRAPQAAVALRKAAWLGLIATAPLLWGPALLAVFSDVALALDATLAGLITGTEVVGNVVAQPDGLGYVKISRPCSSLSNMSLALLCWATALHVSGRRYGGYRFVWAVATMAPVVALNVGRIAAIAYFPEHYDLIHGPDGEAVAGVLTLGLIVGMCWLGLRREDDRVPGGGDGGRGVDAGRRRPAARRAAVRAA